MLGSLYTVHCYGEQNALAMIQLLIWEYVVVSGGREGKWSEYMQLESGLRDSKVYDLGMGENKS